MRDALKSIWKEGRERNGPDWTGTGAAAGISTSQSVSQSVSTLAAHHLDRRKGVPRGADGGREMQGDAVASMGCNAAEMKGLAGLEV
jgi:hypothetical protein